MPFGFSSSFQLIEKEALSLTPRLIAVKSGG
jgi:hypothetical protein